VATEYRFRCGSTPYRWFSERVSVVSAADGHAPELAGVLFDITPRKQMEEQLIHAQKMEAIGQMTGGVAHDFNNMLSVIIGTLNRILSKDEVSAKVHQRLDLAMQAALSCAALTKRLLGFGRRQSLEPQLINLSEQLQTLEPLVARVLGRDIEVIVDCSDDLWSIYLDPSQLEAAIVNLAINARDAMPEGGRLDIVARNQSARKRRSLANDLKPGDYVQLAVTDSGQGMSQDVIARALEPFFTTKGPGKGTGLGLSSIAGFIRQSGGAIALASEVGKGTTITLYLPRATRDARTRPRTDAGDAAQPSPPQDRA
jgi:signal transduction histidine kinase